MSLSGFDSNIPQYSALQGYGFSIRCVKKGWLVLQSPNGGESWQVGSNQNISWKSSNITNAKIEFTTDDGITWTTIIGSTSASAGTYSWTIPNTPSTSCRIKLSDASDSSIKSISSSLFTIWIPTISLSSPNGREIWKVGDIDSIKWTSSNVTNAKIEFSTDNGINWTTIVGSIPASTGYYPWTMSWFSGNRNFSLLI